MLTLAVALLMRAEETVRTHAIYRCPAKEAVGRRFDDLVNEGEYDTLCIDPKPTSAQLKQATAKKLKFVNPKIIDAPANRKWRNATIALVNGKISPREWVARTKGLGETVHFLSSPKTPELRAAVPSAPMDSTYSGRSVLAELLLLSLPGRPCLTTADLWETRDLPDAGKLQSWVLAMHDYCGPMLMLRHDEPFLVTGKPTILRADPKPGLLIFRLASGKKSYTFYFNTGFFPVELPAMDFGHSIIMRGVDMDGPKPTLVPAGSFIDVTE